MERWKNSFLTKSGGNCVVIPKQLDSRQDEFPVPTAQCD